MGLLYLVGYIVVVGFGTFLMKFVHKDMTSAQINFIIAIGMLVITAPILLISQKSLNIPMKHLPLAAISGMCMAFGSVLFVAALGKVAVGPASAIASAYVVFALVLSVLFLKEPLGLVKVAGIILTLTGVVLLSLKTT